MGKYLIELSSEAESALIKRAAEESATPERIAEDILNTMPEGYRDWGEINLSLCK